MEVEVEACLHCDRLLGDNHRAVKRWVPGGSRFVHGRVCKDCWSRRLLGSLLYSADVCGQTPCTCGWCAEYRKLQESNRGTHPEPLASGE